MEFEEVSHFIRAATQTDNKEQINPYNQPISRKPTLSNFVHRLKQHSSKTRFVTQYKKLSVSDSLMNDEDGDIIGDNGKK